MPTPLERPEPPAIATPLAFPGTTVVAVFGPGERAFAEAIRAARPEAALVEATLRHAASWEPRDGGVVAHPDALLDALKEAWPAGPLVVGIGAAFAVAVKATVVVWIADGLPLLALPAPLRAVARDAALVLEEARPGAAEALARELTG
ncbi:MAG: hypothetical protein KC619_10630 [Myxococcales bacterium]|nr:hypothetical protein [Myxococcales bacterium]